ncbi:MULTISPECIES: GNAT family N-acyltransferase [Ramlibacter]|uniref:L-ornithine N(alpha)-acyltransferase n=1 Tax=Ramlibacter aquaticus TaxID=2780094 RepID=A0ABR9SA40_9BURK|nr:MULTISPECIES: GNAT family N-acyltransferase [Ramlibacter]MBE7939089.1 GNAT family N-acetyltransferase [Ramlibacter aquaticus]
MPVIASPAMGEPLPAQARSQTGPQTPPATRLELVWARDAAEVQDAQRLRHQVFAQEMGAQLEDAGSGLDVDRFDAFCDHLLVRAGPREAAVVVGTYRVLPPDAARRAGGFYTDTEFDLSALQALRPRALELGRSCVHPQWRSGAVILAMWSALAAYMQRHALETMIGCASIGIRDGGRNAAALWHALRGTHMAAPQWHVTPRRPLPLHRFSTDGAAPPVAPPLVKGYLRCGARILGAPALDEAFGTADMPLLLHLATLSPRYRRHLLEAR